MSNKDDVQSVNDLSPALRSQFESCMEMRRQAKELESQAEAIKETANVVLLDLMRNNKITAVEDDYGTLRYKVNVRSTITQDKLRQTLLQYVAADLIDPIVEQSSKISTSESVEYRAKKDA